MIGSMPLRYEQIMHDLLGDVRLGKLQPGGRVPSETELATQYGVSRITSRKALEELSQLGVVERQRGRGTFVAQVLPDLTQTDDTRAAIGTGASLHNTIGLILPDFSEVFGLDLLYAIESRLRSSGMHLLLSRTLDRQTDEETAVRELRAMGVAGLIVFPVHGEHYNPVLLQTVLDHFPVVLIDRYLKGIPVSSVSTDNRRAAEELTRHLLESGHRRIAFLSPPVENTSSLEDRLAGFTDALLAWGVPLDPSLLVSTLTSSLPTGEKQGGQDQAVLTRFLDNHTEVTAFFVAEYNLALTLTRALQTLGHQVPEDYSVVCFDAPHHAPIRFTHMRQDEQQMGEFAVNQLMLRLQGQNQVVNKLLPARFVPGDTTIRRDLTP